MKQIKYLFVEIEEEIICQLLGADNKQTHWKNKFYAKSTQWMKTVEHVFVLQVKQSV